MKYTVTYTLKVTDILDSEEVSEEWLADLNLKHLTEVSKEQLNVDDVLVSKYKYFVHDAAEAK